MTIALRVLAILAFVPALVLVALGFAAAPVLGLSGFVIGLPMMAVAVTFWWMAYLADRADDLVAILEDLAEGRAG